MVAWNEPLQVKYTNILLLGEIARCQCVSIATCERAFSTQNVIKIKHKNRLGTKHLDDVLRVTFEGPQVENDYILVEAMELSTCGELVQNEGICIHTLKDVLLVTLLKLVEMMMYMIFVVAFDIFFVNYILQFVSNIFESNFFHQN